MESILFPYQFHALFLFSFQWKKSRKLSLLLRIHFFIFVLVIVLRAQLDACNFFFFKIGQSYWELGGELALNPLSCPIFSAIFSASQRLNQSE